jgi:protein involved in polysaccharide export with SLBB domain
MKIRSSIRVTTCLLSISILSSCGGIRPQQVTSTPSVNVFDENLGKVVPATSNYAVPPEYRLSVGDVLSVKYARHPEFNTAVQISPDGKAALPFLPSLLIAGATVDEARALIESSYSQQFADLPKPDEKTYLISIGDTLSVRFPYQSELDTTTIVRPDGRISLPLIKTHSCEGKSIDQLTSELESLYRPLLSDPVVVVDVTAPSSSAVHTKEGRKLLPLPGMDEVYVSLQNVVPPKIYITGEVGHPGIVNYSWPMTALQAIAAAGGHTNKAEMRTVVILRKNIGNQPSYIVRNLETDLEGLSTNDMYLQPFDVMVIPKTDIAKLQDIMDQYIYNIVPALRNGSIGFSFIKPLGVYRQDIKQSTSFIPTP